MTKKEVRELYQDAAYETKVSTKDYDIVKDLHELDFKLIHYNKQVNIYSLTQEEAVIINEDFSKIRLKEPVLTF